MPNLNFHVAVHRALVAMLIVFPKQPSGSLIHIVARNVCAKNKLKILSYTSVIAEFFCYEGNSVSMATRRDSNGYCYQKQTCPMVT